MGWDCRRSVAGCRSGTFVCIVLYGNEWANLQTLFTFWYPYHPNWRAKFLNSLIPLSGIVFDRLKKILFQNSLSPPNMIAKSGMSEFSSFGILLFNFFLTKCFDEIPTSSSLAGASSAEEIWNSCCRETARRFVSLYILLSHSRTLKIIRNDTVE